MSDLASRLILTTYKCYFMSIDYSKMECREREHEAIDLATLGDPTTLQSLRTYGLLKIWLFPRMKARVDLITWLVRT